MLFLTVWLWYSQLMQKQSLLVRTMLITLGGCNQFLLSDAMLSSFAIYRIEIDHLMTDAPDIDVFVGTPLVTFDHCFVSCVLRVEHSVLEYNTRSTVFLKYRIKWENVRNAVRSFTRSTILKSADP